MWSAGDGYTVCLDIQTIRRYTARQESYFLIEFSNFVDASLVKARVVLSCKWSRTQNNTESCLGDVSGMISLVDLTSKPDQAMFGVWKAFRRVERWFVVHGYPVQNLFLPSFERLGSWVLG